MRTVVVSDLHLGASSGADLLGRADVQAVLAAALRPGDRLVVLGDGLELREVPVRAAAGHAEALLARVGEALGSSGEVVMLGGNHDHGLVSGWIETRLGQSDPPVLSLDERLDADAAGPLARRLAEAALPASLTLAYPGIRLRDDVYALHGHYADVHATVPTFERLVAGAMQRWVSPVPERGATPDDYESVLAPIYAWMHALAQRSTDGVVRAGAGASARAWVAMTRTEGRRARARAAALGLGYAGAVRAVNLAGLGPVRRELTGSALRQGYLTGIAEVLRRLDVEDPYVIWGHSHRAGPLAGDDLGEWVTPSGGRLLNTGSWVFQPHFLGGTPGASPYWPGTAVVVEGSAPPRLEQLLGGWSYDDLRRGPA